MMELNETACCGLNQIHGLSDHPTAQTAIDAFLDYCRHADYNYMKNCYESGPFLSPDFSHLLFTEAFRSAKEKSSIFPHGASQRRYGADFAALISQLKLGHVTSSAAGKNPNTGNMVRCYVWRLNQSALKRYASKRLKELQDASKTR